MKVYTSCTNAGPISVYVQDGKVVHPPLVADDKDFKPWTIEAGGQRYSPEKKFNVAPYVLTERNRLYSKDRILTPMKRVDFDPNGKRNQQNRGKSGYEPIGWNEALDLVAGEIKRVQGTYGPSALTAMTSSHHNWGLVGYKISAFQRFFDLIGYTTVMDNPDSWEGWHWGATHTYGFYWRLGMPEPYDMLEDALKHTEMIVYWSNDPDTTRAVYTGQDSAIWRRWLKEKGVKMVFIDPYYNSTAAAMGGMAGAATRRDTAARRSPSWIASTTSSTSRATLGFEGSPPSWARPMACPRRRAGRPRNPGCRCEPSSRWRATGRA
jgi:trimethylamine-N-oxide reductase (cytochrome c)